MIEIETVAIGPIQISFTKVTEKFVGICFFNKWYYHVTEGWGKL